MTLTFPWNDSEPGELARALEDPALALTPAIARAVWQRAASFRHTDPSIGHGISSALVGAAGRLPGEAPGSGADASSAEIQAVAWCSLAESSNATGRIKDAIFAFERATTPAEAAGDEHLLGQILVGRVHVLALAGRAAESARLAARAEALLKQNRDLGLLAKLYMNRGNAFYQQDRYREAYDTYRDAERVFETAGTRDAVRVGLLMNLAVAATNLERFDEARGLFLRAESLSSALGVAHLEAFARFNHAFLERVRGDFRAALRLLEDAERTFRSQASRDMAAAADRARAEIYLELGMPRRSLELVRGAADIFAAEAMELDARLARADEARSLLAEGDAAEAVPILEDSARWFRSRRNRTREGLTLLDLASARAAIGETGKALSASRAALRLIGKLGLTHAALRARCLIAENLVGRGRLAEAERTLAPALARPGSLTTRSRMELWMTAGNVAVARGRRREARRRFERAAELLERERRFIPGVELRSRTFERFGGVYRELAALELGEPRPRFDFLLDFSEKARARSFADRVTRSSAGNRRVPGSVSLDARRVLLGAVTRRLEEAEAPADGAPDPARVSELRRRVITLEKEIVQDLRREEERESHGARSRNHARSTGELALGDDEVLLEYLLVHDRILALAMGGGRRVAVLLRAPAAEIRECAERVRFQLESMALLEGRESANLAFARRAADAALQELHAALVAPVLGAFPRGGRLVVVPDRFLHRVPFQCLHDGSDYLNARWVVSRLPTVELLGRRRQHRARRKGATPALPEGGVLVSGTVTGGPGFVARELDSVAAHFPGEARVLRDATAGEILRELEGARVAHIVTHGHFRDDNAVFSRLSTADGALFVADLLDLRLRSDLVVLSACQSGEVFTGGGDDLSGVTHAFLAVGARRLIASLWRVHDEATHDLMLAFYRHYVAGGRRDPGRALRDAELETRERWNHPFYWGSFSLHGA